MQRLLWYRGLGAANRAVLNGGAACCRVEFHSVKRMTSTGATWTGDARGPTVEGRPHVVRFGKVGDENRGANPIDPPLEREDKYFWLRDDTRSKPEVIDHLKRERDFLNSKTAPLASATAKIYDEHVAYLNETDTSCPVRQDGFEYYRRTIKGLSYGIWCRRPRTATPFVDSNVPELGQQAGEEILLDANKLAEGKSHCDIGELDTSPSHGRLAYSVDFTGNEVYELHILDLTAGGSVIETLVGPKFSGGFEWGLDDTTLYYTTRDDALRTFRVYRHVIGTALDTDELVFEEKDELFSVGCGKTLEGNHMVIASGSSETSEEFLLDLRAATVPTAPVRPLLRVVRPREFGVRYSVEGINGDAVYISTNIDECINDKIVRATLAAPGDWSNVIVPHDEDVKIDSVSVFRNAIIVGGRSDGLSQIWSLQKDPNGEFSADSSFVRFVPPEPIFDIGLSSNDEFDPATVRISYDSLTTPTEWWELDPSTLQYTSVKQKVVHGYDKTLYKAERLAAEAGDGTKIDISVVYRADLDRTKPQPTLLYGYGSYGICIDPGFSAGILPYIARGVIYCIAHVRGGGENGRAWYEVQGKYLTKRNTFTDFIACAEQLIEDGVTRPDLLATEGRSAGGLLMGAISNMRPDLFNVVLAGVPFVDVMTTMCDPSIPLTTGEWEEWGNPNEWKFHDYMLSYSPMDNVRRQPYPNILIVAGLHDPRVAYWEPAKWAVKLREHSTSTNDVLLKMDLDAGHFSASDRYKYLREKAFEQAYVLSKIAPHTIASA